MDDLPRQKLVEIIAKYALDMINDPRRLKGLLLDLCGQQKKEINTLMMAREEQVPHNLWRAKDQKPYELVLARETQRLLDVAPLTVEAARWAVESWALALRLINREDLVGKAEVYSPALASAPVETKKDTDDGVLLTTNRATPTGEQAAKKIATPSGGEIRVMLAAGVEMIFVHVPAGEFLMGSDPAKDKDAQSDEQPQHKVYLDEYWIGKYPVTNRQYQAFMVATGMKAPDHWENGKIPDRLDEHPVMCVTWYEAIEFCRWVSQVSGQKIALPTEAQWEKAARGVDGQIYPWGNQSPDEVLCNFQNNVGSTTTVGNYSPRGDSPYGCSDMAGNVQEWVADWYNGIYYRNSPTYNPVGPSSGEYPLVRGGTWRFVDKALRVARRDGRYPGWNYDVGFRCSRLDLERAPLAAEQKVQERKDGERKPQIEEKRKAEILTWAGTPIEDVKSERWRISSFLHSVQGSVRTWGVKSAATTRETRVALANGVEMIMVHVPAGEFLMGSDLTRDAGAHESEEPQHKVYLDEYWMGRYPVTNRQYQTFVQAMVTSSPFHWQNGKIPGGLEDHPVVNVSWDEAVKFCQWASQVSGQKIALPTESQWEKAARGTDGRIYPWGDQPPDKSRCNFDRKVGTTTPVGKYSPAGDSPYGCADMAGNVWDWVADWYDEKYYGNSPNRNPSGPASGRYSVLRGGSWNSYDWLLRSAYRYRHPPDTRYNYNGFRCVCSPDPGILVAGMLGF